jgi:hypothetical protein
MPPLLLESGSGTGKTNVLFKHAVDYAYGIRNHTEAKSICFVTVSSRLRNELSKRYCAIEEMERVSLPHVGFFSLQKILEELVLSSRSSIKMAEVCSFREFVHARIEHSAFPVDISEAENEISGVILGSIVSTTLMSVKFPCRSSDFFIFLIGCSTERMPTLKGRVY